MRFLVDAQLPPAMARMLVGLGHQAEHVTDVGPGDATDMAPRLRSFGCVSGTRDVKRFSIGSSRSLSGSVVAEPRCGLRQAR
ncbi:DUF5615 family PIN-like protein, partial [Microbacterium sp.]|uniref:DUF5615 family PIN-like protein n=1 Tax=Microbacterium sp. TaxID=51671 RepID=UPI0025E96722